jgi:hypothetical protein
MLFKTIKEIQEYLPIGVGNNFNVLKPHIANAELSFVKPLLGGALYEELTEFYDGMPYAEPTEVQEAMLELLGKVQHSLIHLAYYSGFDFLNVLVSDKGFSRIESEFTKGLYKYQEQNLKDYFKSAGFNGLDDVLIFIEGNIAHFGEFKLSSNWTVLKQSFLPSVFVTESIPFNLNSSRLIFLSLKPSVSYIEDTVISKILGPKIYAYIKAEMVKDAPAPKVLTILPYIRKPLVYLASALFMEETGAELGDKGLFFTAVNTSTENIVQKQPSEQARILALIARNQKIGIEYLSALKAFLNANLADWPDYSSDAGSLFNRNNSGKKIFVA